MGEKMTEEEKEEVGMKVMEALEENFETHEEKINQLVYGHTKNDFDDDEEEEEEDEDDMKEIEESHHDDLWTPISHLKLKRILLTWSELGRCSSSPRTFTPR